MAQKNEKFYAYKNEWDNPQTGRRWHECGGCRGVVSAKALVCRQCGAIFKNMLKEEPVDGDGEEATGH